MAGLAWGCIEAGGTRTAPQDTTGIHRAALPARSRGGRKARERRPMRAAVGPTGGPSVPSRKFGRSLRDAWSCLASGGVAARTRRTCATAGGRQTRAGARRLPAKLRLGTLVSGWLVREQLHRHAGFACVQKRVPCDALLRTPTHATLFGRGQAVDALRRRMRASGSARAPMNSTPSASSARRTAAGSPSAVAATLPSSRRTRCAPGTSSRIRRWFSARACCSGAAGGQRHVAVARPAARRDAGHRTRARGRGPCRRLLVSGCTEET